MKPLSRKELLGEKGYKKNQSLIEEGEQYKNRNYEDRR